MNMFMGWINGSKGSYTDKHYHLDMVCHELAFLLHYVVHAWVNYALSYVMKHSRRKLGQLRVFFAFWSRVNSFIG